MFSKTDDDYGDDDDDDGDGDGVNLAPRVRLILKETSCEAAGDAVRPSGEVFLLIVIVIVTFTMTSLVMTMVRMTFCPSKYPGELHQSYFTFNFQ